MQYHPIEGWPGYFHDGADRVWHEWKPGHMRPVAREATGVFVLRVEEADGGVRCGTWRPAPPPSPKAERPIEDVDALLDEPMTEVRNTPEREQPRRGRGPRSGVPG